MTAPEPTPAMSNAPPDTAALNALLGDSATRPWTRRLWPWLLLAAVLRRHPQVERVICGHMHRSIVRRFGGTVAMTVPSTAHQIVLDLRPGAPATFQREPPGFAVHAMRDGALVSHVAAVGDHGPVEFYT